MVNKEEFWINIISIASSGFIVLREVAMTWNMSEHLKLR